MCSRTQRGRTTELADAGGRTELELTSRSLARPTARQNLDTRSFTHASAQGQSDSYIRTAS